MAIIRSIVVGRGSKGSIGDVTVRTVAGRVVASQKIAKKGGLSTYRQVLHQISMANIMRAFTELNLTAPNGKGMYQSFPDRPAGMSNANMFVKYNFAEGNVAAVVQTKEEAAADLLFPAPFIVSRGTLAPIASQFAVVQESTSADAFILTPLTSFTPEPGTTMGDFFTALKEAMPDLKEGDTITFFVMGYKDNEDPATKMYAIQLIVNSADDTPVTECGITFGTSSGHFAIDITETLSVSGNKYDIAVVLGRNTANGYKVSDAQFTNNMLSSQAYIAHSSKAATELAALSYGYKEDPFLQQTIQE